MRAAAGLPAVVEVYRNRTRRCWSLRVGGRVVGYADTVALESVRLRHSEAARIRAVSTGARTVHAVAAGELSSAPRSPNAARLRYRIEAPGFRAGEDGVVVTAAAAAWFEADGSAWVAGGVP